MQGLHLKAPCLSQVSACQPWGVNIICPTENALFTVQNLPKGVFWEVPKIDYYYKNWGKKLILYVS